MIIWVVFTTILSIFALSLQSQEVLRFICIGSGLAFWHVRDYFPCKTREFNDAIKYGSFYFYFYSFIIYTIKVVYDFY